jgi:hypothetical protein
MNETPADPRDLRLVVIFLRSLRFWDRTKLATESGLSRNTVDACELGGRCSRRTLERIAAAVGFPTVLLDPLLALFRRLRILWEQGEPQPERLAAIGDEADCTAEQWAAIVRSAVTLYLAHRSAAPTVDGDPEEVRRAARASLVLAALESAAWAWCGTCQVCRERNHITIPADFCGVANGEDGSMCCDEFDTGVGTLCGESGSACYGIIVDGGGGDSGGGGSGGGGGCSYQTGWCPAECFTCGGGGGRPAI